MSNLFSDLQKVKEEQTHVLENATPLPVKEEKKPSGWEAHKVAQNPAQKIEQVSKSLSKPMSSSFSQEAVEELAFSLRKSQQAKINATIPVEWKEKLDHLAFRLKVGKYELLTYMVGVFLGEVEEPKR